MTSTGLFGLANAIAAQYKDQTSTDALLESVWPSGTVKLKACAEIFNWPDTDKIQVFSLQNLEYCPWFYMTPHVLQGKQLEDLFYEVKVAKEWLEEKVIKKKSVLDGGGHTWRQYLEFCTKKYSGNLTLTEKKAVEFLEYRVHAREDKAIREGNSRQKVIMCLPEAAESGIKFLNYIRDFQRVLDGRKFANMPAISNFLQKLRTDYNQEVRNPENPGEESRKKTKRNTFEENNNILDGYWSGRNVEATRRPQDKIKKWMRGILSHNINEPLGRRSHEIRSIKISSLGLWDKSEDYGPAKCVVLYATVFGVKDDKDKPRPHDINWLRTKDRLRCPQGSIANHLVWLNDISKQEEIIKRMFKDLVAIERWVENRKVEEFPIPTYRNCYLTFYKDSDEAISGNTYVKDITDAFNANGITGKKSKGHMPRSEMASKLTELRYRQSASDIKAYGGWDRSISTLYMDGGVPMGQLLPLSGWDVDEGNKKCFSCFWAGNDSDIPDALKQAVMPGLDSLLEKAVKVSMKAPDELRSFIDTCKVLQYLRNLYIEDFIYKQPLYHKFPAYQHNILKMEELQQYKKEEELRMRKRASMAAVSYTPPPPMKIEPVFDIPEIYKPPKLFTDGKSLFDTYEQWKSEIKEDYTMRTENGRELSWKGIEEVHGGASAKDVYHKLRPFCQLVDSFIEQGYSEQKVLGKLEAIRLNFGVLPSNFMKVVLKSWHLDTTSSQFSKYIPIDKIQFRSLVLEMLTE